jgi:hypothetical protein
MYQPPALKGAEQLIHSGKAKFFKIAQSGLKPILVALDCLAFHKLIHRDVSVVIDKMIRTDKVRYYVVETSLYKSFPTLYRLPTLRHYT